MFQAVAGKYKTHMENAQTPKAIKPEPPCFKAAAKHQLIFLNLVIHCVALLENHSANPVGRSSRPHTDHHDSGLSIMDVIFLIRVTCIGWTTQGTEKLKVSDTFSVPHTHPAGERFE